MAVAAYALMCSCLPLNAKGRIRTPTSTEEEHQHMEVGIVWTCFTFEEDHQGFMINYKKQ